MKLQRWLVVPVVGVLGASLAACGGPNAPEPAGPSPIGGQVIAPVTMGVGELPGAIVDLVVGQVLNINTGVMPVDAYTGAVEDPKVAEFVKGRTDGSATFNPGITALAPGSTGVILSSDRDGSTPRRFTVNVTPRN